MQKSIVAFVEQLQRAYNKQSEEFKRAVQAPKDVKAQSFERYVVSLFEGLRSEKERTKEQDLLYIILLMFIIDYDGDYFKKESLPLKERVTGYVYQESYFEGQRSFIQMMIADKEELGLSENQIIEMAMESIGLTKAEAKQLYDELLEDLEK
ncbi:hypothetical protein SN811_08910 [Ligilactobacillus agilis]|uniref:Uncharacterized protein n=1 Tax=Ligilactobacillus agilis TaxID=1601 RepID=A0A6F9Y4A2_9LACO|nr:hypothetical protein [Ligilactobacillus agilis]GET12391.1 hypothetical protein SN811_08910 [Ligilactobacillus agilis]